MSEGIRSPGSRRDGWCRWAVALMALAVFFATATPAFARGGYDFRNFMKNPPHVGSKAPLLRGVDIKGKPMEMRDFVKETHLVVIFGALT